MKTMLVTGGCGFIGSNLIRYLLTESDYDGRIINLDKLTYAGNPENLADLAASAGDRYGFVEADLVDREAVESVFDRYEVDAVCHLAAESHVDRSIYSPGEFIQTNIVGTYNLLEAARARQERIELFHHVSTDEVYGSLGDEGLFQESTPYHPNSPYSASKASSDHLVRAYHHTYGLPVTVSNCSNNYGPYQFPEKLIPLMILNAIERIALPVYGEGQNVRDWLYVRDHCTGIWTIMKKGVRGETYNIGGRNELKNLFVVETIADLVDELLDDGAPSRRELITFVKDRPGHDWRYAIDCSKIERDLGWVPEETFDTGLRKTIEWYLANPEWIDHVRSGEYRAWIKSHYHS